MLAPSHHLVNLMPDEEIVSYKRKKRPMRVPKYRTVALAGEYLSHDYTKEQGQDFLTLFIGLSSKAQACFVELHQNYDELTGVSMVSPKGKTATQRNSFSLGFKELHSKGFVKKIKKCHYLINPRLYFHPTSFEQVDKLWHSI